LIPGEGDGEQTPGGTGTGDGLADNISASVSYKEGPIYVALAHDQYDDTDGQDSNTLTRLVGIYKFSGMQLGLFYQTGVESASPSDDEVDTLGVSFNAKTGGNGKAKLQYIMSEDSADPANETTLMAVGYDHQVTKLVTGYVMYANVEEDDGTNTDESSFLGAGMVVKF
jgi:predicted porin